MSLLSGVRSVLTKAGLPIAVLFFGITLTIVPSLADEEVNIISFRQPFLIEPLMMAFTKETGIKTNVQFLDKRTLDKIRLEGANSPIDVILTADISRLEGAKEMGITAPVDSQVLNSNIPSNFRDPEGHWFGLTTRARIVFASKDRVNRESITYAELADPKWKGRICTSSGQHTYTIGLISSIIAHEGEEYARNWLKGLKSNLAHKPKGNDLTQVHSIFSSECDISIGNTYYMGMMLTNEMEPEQKDWANSVRIIFPDTESRGTHVNVSGVQLMKHAPNRENAIKLMEFLSSASAQGIYASNNFEYPVNEEIPVDVLVISWGDFKRDNIPLSAIAKHRKRASELVDEIEFDEGPSG